MNAISVPTVGDLLDRADAVRDAVPAANRIVTAQDNNPPQPTPFEAIKAEIDGLYAEAKNWLDGAPIETEGQASEVGKLRDMLRKAMSRGDELRVAEAKPFDEAKAEVQARYNPLIHKDKGLCKIAIDTCNRAIAPYLKKIDDAQRKLADDLRIEAERVAREARDATVAARESASLDDRERAEDLLADAKGAVKLMKHAEKAKPQVAGLTKAIGMKSVWSVKLVDPAAAIAHYRVAQPAALKVWLAEQAAQDLRAGPKPPPPIPGFEIVEDRVPA